MSVELFVTVSIFCLTVLATVVLLKFWMDFKLQVWDRENTRHIIVQQNLNLPKRQHSFFNVVNSNLDNKKKNSDIIIDCEAKVIKYDFSEQEVYNDKRRNLKKISTRKT